MIVIVIVIIKDFKYIEYTTSIITITTKTVNSCNGSILSEQVLIDCCMIKDCFALKRIAMVLDFYEEEEVNNAKADINLLYR